jgi:hypothetical protein
VAALAEQGYRVAHGDRGRLVIVDAQGVVQNLMRQIDGAKKRDIEVKLGEVLESLPTLAQLQTMQQAQPLQQPPLQQDAVPSSPAKRVEIAHVAAIGRIPQGERNNAGESGDSALRTLEGEQESVTHGDMHIRAVHYGEVGVYATPTHAEYVQHHRNMQILREAQELDTRPTPLWREVIAGVCRV